ncbi:MAG: hypothetical protein JXA54_01850 [Candidatus Heimdallarchaeota archaeon]|nr:hypothetical protein [Candidatus Heimdallarchaeota archaeon]
MSYLFDELKSKDKGTPVEDKILLMGLQQAGKTAIKDVVFFGKSADSVENYMATIHYERQFIDEEKKSLIIDSGGQESYWNEAVTHFRHLVFSNVKLLLWIIDMTRADLFEESERRFSFTIRQYKKENPDGNIAILCHKVDKIPPEELVPMLEHVRESFSDPKYVIRFEPSSIYYPDSLKELVFTLMKDAGINTKRFELITNIGQKVEESEEFQSYKMEHKEDPRIQQLMDFLNPKPEATLPTYGKTSVTLDLSIYEIIEIVLIDKETFTPITGTSSKHMVSPERSMDYIIALKDFKEAIRSRPTDDASTISIVTSSNDKVHGMIVDLVSNYLLITSFEPITDEKTKIFYKLIRDFAQSADASQAAVVKEVSTDIKAPIKSISSKTETSKVQPPIVAPTIEDRKEKLVPPIQAPIAENLIIPPVAPIESEISTKIEIPLIEVTGEIDKDSKSMFSFLNRLKNEHEKQIYESTIVDESPVKQTEVVTNLPLVAPLPVITQPEPPIEQQMVENVIEAPIITEKTEEIVEDVTIVPTETIEITIQSAHEQVTSETSKIEKSKLKRTEEVQPKSRFLKILDEERKRYKIRQVNVSSLENGSINTKSNDK